MMASDDVYVLCNSCGRDCEVSFTPARGEEVTDWPVLYCPFCGANDIAE